MQIPMDELTHTGINKSKNNQSHVKLSVFKNTFIIYEACKWDQLAPNPFPPFSYILSQVSQAPYLCPLKFKSC